MPKLMHLSTSSLQWLQRSRSQQRILRKVLVVEQDLKEL